ncbi:hypothetical protein QMK38_15410 [Lysinibacillus fusiformis]|nr:hypothetical protein [Lysinibacillus fusiformis]
MLAMSEVNCIKTLRNEKGLSISTIATAINVNWRTAKKDGMTINYLKKKRILKRA